MVGINAIESDVIYGLGLLASFGPKVDVVGIYANGSGNAAGQTGNTGLSSSVINSLVGASGTTASFGQMFANARPLEASVRETSKVMEHPVETGVSLADHHIINPVEIDMPLLIKSQYYAAVYQQIRTAFINATPLSVKTRVGVYNNMIIAALPHKEDAEMYDAIVVLVQLKQVLYATSGNGSQIQSYQPLAPANSNTLAAGLQQAAAIGTQLVAAAGSVASYASAAHKGLL